MTEQTTAETVNGFTRRDLLAQARRHRITVPRGASIQEIDRLISEAWRADHEAIRNARLR